MAAASPCSCLSLILSKKQFHSSTNRRKGSDYLSYGPHSCMALPSSVTAQFFLRKEARFLSDSSGDGQRRDLLLGSQRMHFFGSQIQKMKSLPLKAVPSNFRRQRGVHLPLLVQAAASGNTVNGTLRRRSDGRLQLLSSDTGGEGPGRRVQRNDSSATTSGQTRRRLDERNAKSTKSYINNSRSNQKLTRSNTRPQKLLGEKTFLPSTLVRDPSGGDKPALEELELELGFCNPFKKYTPERVRARVVQSPDALLSLAGRGTQIVWSLGMYWLSLTYDCLVGQGQEMVPKRAQQLRDMLCSLGPSFIKAGQVLANRPDIIREDYMNELCVLQDDVPQFPDHMAFAIIEEEAGRPLEQIFSRISPTPVAAASLGQVYRATLRDSGEEVAVKVQRPEVEPIIYRDLFLFRTLASFLNDISLKKLGCNAELIVDEFGEKLLEELDYTREARNIEDFLENFRDDPTVKIPQVYRNLSGPRVLVMEWIDGIRCTDPQGIKDAGIDIDAFITVGVSAALRQLLEFGLFHGDPHPGNIFAMRDGRIAYVDFGNVAELSQYNKQILIDAIVHAVNEDYVEMAGDFTRLGFLAPGTDITPIVPALEAIWQNSTGKGLADFNFRTVTCKFNEMVFQYPIRIPERFSLVIRSLLTQEGICLTLQPDFKFLEVAYPYVAKRLLTDPDPALRARLIQILFNDGMFQWKRLENLIQLAKEQVALMARSERLKEAEDRRLGRHQSAANGSAKRSLRPSNGRPLFALPSAAAASFPAPSPSPSVASSGLNLKETIRDGARVLALDAELRKQLLMAFTEDSRLHLSELADIYRLVETEVNPTSLVGELIGGLPSVTRDIMLSWSDSVLAESN